MFEIKGKYLRSRFYAQKIPAVSLYVYEMSRVSTSSIWYKTIPYPTRIISIQDDFFGDYNKRLQKYIRQAEARSEEHTSELQSRGHLVCRLLLEKKNISDL